MNAMIQNLESQQFALLRNVTVITMSTKESASTLLPCSLFTCETLVALKLHGNFKMKIPTFLLLPHVKFLHLSSVKFVDECSLNRFISGCPLLEDMVIKAKWTNIENINISLPRLKHLTMDFGEGLCDFFHRDLTLWLIFQICCGFIMLISWQNLESLEEAHIELSLDLEDGDSDTFRDSALDLLKGTSSTKHLSLTGNGVEVGDFYNLSDLELGWSKYVNWTLILPKFLHSSPVLENLIFTEGLEHRESNDAYDKNFWIRQRKCPSCLLSHLKTITIPHFHAYEEEVDIARYFVRHGKVLRELILDSRVNSKEERRQLMKLYKMRKASKDCSIELLESEGWSLFF
ncbi:hypothetical protein Cgig2_013276 [Carnegiea gigantea]|uniref:FBD domain-containing protein n=1 Tax=Carnegiea gigantea TaxID=171969 RepID=A0A9Q1QBU4_9CARY|nr:hypothetical protein Cgig2_013276 [Carnegiea gigantea]